MALPQTRSPTLRAIAAAMVAFSPSMVASALDLTAANCPDLLTVPMTLTEDTTLLLDVPTVRYGDPTANWIVCDEVSAQVCCSLAALDLPRSAKAPPPWRSSVYKAEFFERNIMLRRLLQGRSHSHTSAVAPTVFMMSTSRSLKATGRLVHGYLRTVA